MFANPSRKLMLKERKILNSSPPPPPPLPSQSGGPHLGIAGKALPAPPDIYIATFEMKMKPQKWVPFSLCSTAWHQCSAQRPRNLTTSTDQKNVNMERSLTLCKASAHPGSHARSAVLWCICFIFSPKVFPQTKLSCGVNTISSNLFPSPFAFSVCVCLDWWLTI